MKKHLFIWSLVLVASGLFAIALFNPFEGSEKDQQTVITASDIDAKIEQFGNGKYDDATFKNLDMSIRGLRTAGKVSNSHAATIESNLQIAKQKALSRSMREWFSSSCSGSGIDALYQFALECKTPIAELSTEIQNYKGYKQALSYSGKLTAFLNGEYSDTKANNLKQSYQALISGKSFKNCPKITSLSAQIKSETSAFKEFYTNVIATVIYEYSNVDEVKDYFYINDDDEMKLRKFKFYYKKYQDRIKNESKIEPGIKGALEEL
jgi:hypothetical protein